MWNIAFIRRPRGRSPPCCHNPVAKLTRKHADMTPSHQRTRLVRRSFLLAPLAWALPARAQIALPPALLEQGGMVLATLIQAERDTAIADGVRPVPPRIYSTL